MALNPKPLNEVILELKDRAKMRQDFRVRNASGLQFTVVNPATKEYAIRLDGKDYLLTENGFLTACQLCGMDPKYFKRYPDPREFPNHFKGNATRKGGGALIRTEGNLVQAVLPAEYQQADDAEILERVGVVIDQFDKCQGVIVQSSDSLLSSYRIPFGDVLMKQDEIYGMLEVSNSEFGRGLASLQFGTYRVVCTNGSTRREEDFGHMWWNHLTEKKSFLDRMFVSLDRGIRQIKNYTAPLTRSSATLMQTDPRALVTRLQEKGKISLEFSKAAKLMIDAEGKKVQTEYDLFNVFTDAAKRFKLATRQKIEATADKLMRQGFQKTVGL